MEQYYEINKNGNSIKLDLSDMANITEYYHKYNIYEFLTGNYALSKNSKNLTNEEINVLIEDIYRERQNADPDDIEYNVMDKQNIEYKDIDENNITLNDYIKNKKIDTNILNILVKSLEDFENNHQQELNKISLDFNDIYYADKRNKAIFKIKPDNKEKDFYYEVSKMLVRVLRNIDTNDKKAIALGYSLFVASSKSDYKIKNLSDICNKHINNSNNIDINEIANKQMNEMINDEISKLEEDKPNIYNKEDYNKLAEWTSQLDNETLKELQNILIQCEYDKNLLSDFTSAVDNSLVNNNQNMRKIQNNTYMLYDTNKQKIYDISIIDKKENAHISFEKYTEILNNHKDNNFVLIQAKDTNTQMLSSYEKEAVEGLLYAANYKGSKVMDMVLIDTNDIKIDQEGKCNCKDLINKNCFSYKFNENKNFKNHINNLEINNELKKSQKLNINNQEETNKMILK